MDDMGEGVEGGEIGDAEAHLRQWQPAVQNGCRSSTSNPTNIGLLSGEEMEGAREGAFMQSTCQRR